MKTILVPTDYSQASRNALSYAAGLAGALHARLILFHSYMIPAPVSEFPYMLVSVEEARIENEERIRQEAEGLYANSGIEAEWMVRIGIPADEIRAAAEEKGADLVVMASSGIIRHYGIPVMLIPPQAIFRPINRITYATDFGYSRNAGLFDPLTTLLRIVGSALDILHVNEGTKENGPKDAADDEREILGKKELESIFQPFKPLFSMVKDVSVIQGIQAFARQQGSDLLVMVAHKHGLLERLFGKSSTREMAHETNLPLLVLQG